MRLPVAADHTGDPDPERATRAALPAEGKATPHAANDRARPASRPATSRSAASRTVPSKPFRGRRRGSFGRKPAARAA